MATFAKQDESCVARAEARLAGDATPPFKDDLEDASRALTLVPQVRYGLIATPAHARRAAADVAFVRTEGKRAEGDWGCVPVRVALRRRRA